MARSMTGYGRFEQQLDGRNIAVEIKSVNHRYFEFSSRVPRSYGYLEEKLKSLVQANISRGKVDVFVSVNAVDGGDAAVSINRTLAKSYLAALRELSSQTGLHDDISLSYLSRFPDIFTVERTELDEDTLWNDVRAVASEAIDRFVAMREREGERLQADLLSRLKTVEQLTSQVEAQSPQTVADYRNRLTQKLTELLADRGVDEARVLTEAAIFAERIAVDEETVRLASHVAQFRDILNTEQAVGRKLDFLTQELNREANTIGSKAQDAAVARMVVQLKSELEKVREQIQNLE